MSNIIKPKILVVDDEADICELMSIALTRMGVSVITVNSIFEAKQSLQNNLFDLVFTDMNLKNGDGLDLVRHVSENYPAIPCAVITAYGDMQTAVKALKNGAFDFVAKPIKKQALQALLENGLKLSKFYDWGTLKQSKLVGESEIIATIRMLIEKSAESDVATLIQGSKGTGKRLIAKLIQRQSLLTGKPFISVNLGTLNESQIEQVFFGHEEQNNALYKANGGILLINEIDKMPLIAQAKLAEVLKSQYIKLNNQTIGIKIKLISTSNIDLANLAADNLFNNDLFYQINILTIFTPDLVNIKSDLQLLIDYFINQLIRYSHLIAIALSDEAKQALLAYEFPGNVRELETILQRALALSDNKVITISDLQLPEKMIDIKSFDFNIDKALPEQLENLEKQRIVNALQNNRWNKTIAAKELGISFRALRYRIKKFGIK
jgi:two-component system response regulator PilR (NtrC family)